MMQTNILNSLSIDYNQTKLFITYCIIIYSRRGMGRFSET